MGVSACTRCPCDTTVARGLCWNCYNRARLGGTLAEHPRSRQEVTDEQRDFVVWLRTRGYTAVEAARLAEVSAVTAYRIGRAHGIGRLTA